MENESDRSLTDVDLDQYVVDTDHELTDHIDLYQTSRHLRGAPRAEEADREWIRTSRLSMKKSLSLPSSFRRSAVQQIWHIQDSLALAFREKSLKLLNVCPLRSEAVPETSNGAGGRWLSGLSPSLSPSPSLSHTHTHTPGPVA